MRFCAARCRDFQIRSATLRVPFLSTFASTTATGGSALIEVGGTTMSNWSGPSWLTARKASFSQASSTSPMPRSTKVVVEPAGAGIEHGDVLVERLHEFEALGLVAAVLRIRERPCGEEIPAGAAGGLRIGRDHLHAVLDEVRPVLDALRVSLRTRKTIVDV